MAVIATVVIFPGKAFCVTAKQEEDMSREFLKFIFSNAKLIKDPVIVNYVNKIGRKIVNAVPPQPFKYHFYVIENDQYNAFASPAGHIFINSGLLAVMENEEQLAGILAHETAHVVCRHISQRIERAKKMDILTLAGIVAGIFLGLGGSGTSASALTVGTMAANQSVSLAYSRENERQADQIGLKYLLKAGYDGSGMIPVLEKIRSKQWFGSDQIPTYMTTHPGTKDRITYIDTWLANKNNRPEKKIKIDPYEFKLVHTKIIAAYGNIDLSLKKYKMEVTESPNNLLSHYGYGLSLARAGQFEKAAAQIKLVLIKMPFDPYVLKDLGKIYFFGGKYNAALDTLENALSMLRNDPDGLFYLGRAQLEAENYKDASETFQIIEKKYPAYDINTLYYLGESYGKQGVTGDAHYYLGIFYYKKKDLNNAFFHLNRASENVTDPDTKDKIATIIKKIKKTQRTMERRK